MKDHYLAVTAYQTNINVFLASLISSYAGNPKVDAASFDGACTLSIRRLPYLYNTPSNALWPKTIMIRTGNNRRPIMDAPHISMDASSMP